MKQDIGSDSESRRLSHLHAMPPLGGPRQNIAMMFGVKKTRMVWLPRVRKSLRIRLLVLTVFTNETYRQTDRQTPHDGMGRACTASRGKNDGSNRN